VSRLPHRKKAKCYERRLGFWRGSRETPGEHRSPNQRRPEEYARPYNSQTRIADQKEMPMAKLLLLLAIICAFASFAFYTATIGR